MKDARFIELLNLYIDQELSADEVGELEQEIVRNPSRRRIYEQYCRMHRGCALLFENARLQAPDHPKLQRAALRVEEKVLGLPDRGLAPVTRGPWGKFAWAGGLAAALAIAALQGPAIMVALRGPVDALPESAAIAANTPSPAVATPTARQSDYQAIGQFDRQADSSRLVFLPAATPEADWIHRLELTPLQRVSVESLRFSSPATEAESRTFAGSRPFTPAQQNAAEFSAFQFQK